MNGIVPLLPYVALALGLYVLKCFAECHFGICDYLHEYKRLRRRPRPEDTHAQYLFRCHERSIMRTARDCKYWRPIWAWTGGTLVTLGLISFVFS